MTEEKRTDIRVGSSDFHCLNRPKMDFNILSVSDLVMTNMNQEGSLYHPLSVPYNYKYSGKELQETGMYDFGWRQYMPDIGRWNGMDQLAEKYFSTSPYAYVLNNPVSFIDPDGRRVTQTGEGSWTFDGASIQSLWDYLVFGGDFGELTTALENTDFGSGPLNDFWSNFQGGSWDNPIPLPEVLIVGQKRDNSNFWDGAYDYVLAPENINQYLKMRRAMHEGQLGVAIFYSSVVAMPYLIAYGTTHVGSYAVQSSVKFTLDIGTKAAFKGGDLKTGDFTSAIAGALVPGKLWLLSGAASESTELATQAAMGDQIDGNDLLKAGVKSFMVSPLGSATGSAAEGVFKSTLVGEVVNSTYNNGVGALTDHHMQE